MSDLARVRSSEARDIEAVQGRERFEMGVWERERRERGRGVDERKAADCMLGRGIGEGVGLLSRTR